MTFISQANFLLSYFMKNPERDIPHQEIVDWATKEYKKRFDRVLRDPDRAIRKLSQSGYLIKVSKGIYKYDPEYIVNRQLEDFSPADRKAILERDGYKCVVCGAGRESGIDLHVDHIKPKDLGGRATLSNGQTLCAKHNFRKKNYKQTETGKKMFITLRNAALETGDDATVKFCEDILATFDKHNVNGHIEWK